MLSPVQNGAKAPTMAVMNAATKVDSTVLAKGIVSFEVENG